MVCDVLQCAPLQSQAGRCDPRSDGGGLMRLAPGRHTVELTITRGPEREGDVALVVDGTTIATGRVPRMVGMLSSTGMDIGRAIAPVNRHYTPPFAYGGRIHKVVFELPERSSKRDRKEEAERQGRAAMARQ